MCRKRPGPRCSNTATHRFDSAVHNLQMAVRRKGDRELSELTARQRTKYLNAIRREAAARKVYFATPAGQDGLRTLIDESRAARNRSRSPARRAVLATVIEEAEVSLAEGVERRANSYADLKLAGEERKPLRDQSVARGGNMGANAHPIQDAEVLRRRREGVSASAVELREWTADDVKRANSWVEASPDAVENPNAPRLPRAARNSDGNRVPLGSPVDGVEAKSKRLRVNSPDGSVSEGRHDWHVTKNDDGKYVVSVRSTVATSWEDASPIDETRQNLGHMLSDSASSRGDIVAVVGEYDSLRGAQIARGRRMNNHNSAAVTALMGRDVLVERAGSSSDATQVRGLPTWFRYTEDATPSGMSN